MSRLLQNTEKQQFNKTSFMIINICMIVIVNFTI